jgi:hypothetical protein
MIKISIIFFHQRIFEEEKFRHYLHGTQIFNFLLVGAYLAVDFAQCIPLSHFWDGWTREASGRCVDINIVLDVWMIGLPASQIWGMNMQFAKKAQVLLMFGLGIL